MKNKNDGVMFTMQVSDSTTNERLVKVLESALDFRSSVRHFAMNPPETEAGLQFLNIIIIANISHKLKMYYFITVKYF